MGLTSSLSGPAAHSPPQMSALHSPHGDPFGKVLLENQKDNDNGNRRQRRARHDQAKVHGIFRLQFRNAQRNGQISGAGQHDQLHKVVIPRIDKDKDVMISYIDGKILKKVILKKRKMLGATINNVSQFKFVRIYNRQKEEIQKYKRLNKDYTEEDIRFVKLILFYEIISEHITYLSDPIICLLGGISIIKGNMTLRKFNSLIAICYQNTNNSIFIW